MMVPEIAPPIDGDNFVLVTKTVPGATLRVFDKDAQVGSGTGHVITLVRPLWGGEIISVVQETGPCPPALAYTIMVQPE